jgi:hypothetical protein
VAALLATAFALSCSNAFADDYFAVNANALRPGASSYALRRLDADHMSTSGDTAVRMDILWNDVQPLSTNSGNFASYDPVIADLAQRGIRVNPMVGYSAKWASSLDATYDAQTRIKAPPADPQAYALFAAKVAARYGRNGTFWKAFPTLPYLPMTTYEIWNEENSTPYWHPAPSAAAYDVLLSAASDRIHIIDPVATVMVGGLVSQDPKTTTIDGKVFLAQMVAADPTIGSKIGAVGLHSYANTAATTVDNITELRATMRTLGLNVPIALNEWGAATGGPGAITEAVRSTLMSGTVNLLANTDCNLLYVAPYTWQTPRLNTTDRQDWFGLTSVSTTGVPSLLPSGSAYFNTSRSISRTSTATFNPLCAVVATTTTTTTTAKKKKR